MEVNERTIERGISLVGYLLRTHRDEMDEAFRNSEESLTVNLKLQISPDKGRLKLEAGINFVTDRVKDSATETVDENQISIFEESGGGLTIFPKVRVGASPWHHCP